MKRNVILIDDGIASGGTTLACCNLLEKFGSKVQSVLAMINHTYSAKSEALKQYTTHTLFDFDDKSSELVRNHDNKPSAEIHDFQESGRMLKAS